MTYIIGYIRFLELIMSTLRRCQIQKMKTKSYNASFNGKITQVSGFR